MCTVRIYGRGKSCVNSMLSCVGSSPAELPESMCLDFDCGAQIKLGFAAEFSNVLVIYTHIVKKPPDMSFCQAHVTDFSQVSPLLLSGWPMTALSSAPDCSQVGP